MTKICKNLNWTYRQMLVSNYGTLEYKKKGGFIRCKKNPPVTKLLLAKNSDLS